METLVIKRLDQFEDAQLVKDFFAKHEQDCGDLFRCQTMRSERDVWFGGYVGEELRGIMFLITMGFPHHQVHVNAAPNFRCKYLRKFLQQCFEQILASDEIQGLAVGLFQPHYNWIRRICNRYGFELHEGVSGKYDIMLLEFANHPLPIAKETCLTNW